MKLKLYEYLILFIFFVSPSTCNESNVELQSIISKECESLTNENKFLCENLIKAQSESKSKTKYRVEAHFFSNGSNETSSENSHKYDLFNLHMPINTCKPENCEFCCLSTNRCGSKKQCENRRYFLPFFHIAFIILCVILVSTVAIKCIMVDSEPDQSNDEKIGIGDLQELINLFTLINNNKKKIVIT
jgi:hypothetical protein